MSNRNTYAIIGAGAVGGLYGAMLQRAGFEVHFLFNTDYNHVLKNGLIIESPWGNFNLPNINAYDTPQDMPRCDVVVIALKTTANSALPNILPYLIDENSIVIILQNGLGNDTLISELVDTERILGGLCFLCSNKIAPGHIRHLDYGLITLGEYRKDGLPAGITPQLNRIGCDLEDANIPIKLEEDLALAQWKKLVWNIPFNGLSVARNELTDRLITNPQTRSLCIIMMQEVANASAACARSIEQAFIDKMLTDTEKMKSYAPSMKLDFDNGKPMEIESIYGNPIRAAKTAGIAMPETEHLYRQLLAINPLD